MESIQYTDSLLKQYTVALDFQSIAYKRYQAVMQIPPGDEAKYVLQYRISV